MPKFWDVIQDNDIRNVADFLQQPRLLHERNIYGATPLMVAVGSMDRRVEFIKLLIDAGSDVNAKTKEGYTPLHYAVDVDGPTCRGEIPLQIIQLLTNAGARLEEVQHWGWTPLMRAVLEGTTEEVAALLSVGADPNHLFPDHSMPNFICGRTILMAAVSTPDKLKLLIEAGADVNVPDSHHQTILDYAHQLLNESDRDEYRNRILETLHILEQQG